MFESGLTSPGEVCCPIGVVFDHPLFLTDPVFTHACVWRVYGHVVWCVAWFFLVRGEMLVVDRLHMQAEGCSPMGPP